MIHVVYTITKKNSVRVHDVVACTEQHWLEGNQVTGGIIEAIRKTYPESEFDVEVSTLISTGKQRNE